MSETSKPTAFIVEIATLVSAVWFRKHEGALTSDPHENAIEGLVRELRGLLDSLSRSARTFIIEQIFFLEDFPAKTAFAIQCLCLEYAANSVLREFQLEFQFRDERFDQRDAVLVRHTAESAVVEAYLEDAESSDEDSFHWAMLERLQVLLSGREEGLQVTESLVAKIQRYVDKNLPGRCAQDFSGQFFKRFHTEENLNRLLAEVGKERAGKRIAAALGYALEDLLGLPSTRPLPKEVGL